MRRLVALLLAFLLGASAPAFAQQAGSPGSDQSAINNQPATGDNQQGTTDDGQQAADSANSAFAQAPGPFGNVSPFLIIGGIAGGAGLIAYAVSQNNNDNNNQNNSSSP